MPTPVSREVIETKPLIAVREFMGTNSRPVTMPEMSEFWKSCSPEDKAQFHAELQKWDGVSTFVKA